jgi:hypothetical protein
VFVDLQAQCFTNAHWTASGEQRVQHAILSSRCVEDRSDAFAIGTRLALISNKGASMNSRFHLRGNI